ncbi:hypothetical protein B0T17DRAFT_588749 [Bombardia bombarda]|uniref:Uncharacterized protein n=1 Tax=Bombardia bombarda TaxID=252184 RepID=A0AA40C913_9PEZI|nr:hypothetical protein B0T17DRAFT_588749 [Bombardia bombarda]
MGNTQSTTELPRKQSHKLSKPRTGNPTTTTAAGLLSPSALSSFSNSTRRFSNARMSSMPPPPTPESSTASSPALESLGEDFDDSEQGFEARPSVVSVQQTESKRRSLFRSKSSQEPPKSERRNSVGPVSRVADKLDRANSMTYESALSYYAQPAPENIWPGQPRSRASWNYDMGSYEAKRLLNLVEEPTLEHATTISENRLSVVSETTWKCSNPADPANQIYPASTPISRANSDLSLYMPVRRRSIIQTPGVATRANSFRNSPVMTRPNVRFSHPTTPNLSRQPSFESYRGGIISMPPRIADPDTLQRVVTPCEDDYQSTGAFKLGSLRITNGAASPASIEVEKEREGGNSGQSETGVRSDYFSGSQPLESNVVLNEVLQSVEQPPAVIQTIEAPRPRAVSLSPIASSFMSMDVSNQVLGTAADNVAIVTTDSHTYLSDINFSPFVFDDHPLSPKLETTSKTTALEDQLFEDDSQPEYSSVEVLDVRLDPSAKSQHGQAPANAMQKTFERADSGFISAKSPVSEFAHKPLTKADSGYSSNVSLQTDETYPPPQREPPPPPVPPKNFIPSSASPRKSHSAHGQAKGGFRSASNASRRSRQIPKPISCVLPYDSTGPRSPGSMSLTPMSTRSGRSDNSGSTLSIGSGTRRPSKLQRLLSGARRPATGPLTVHTTHVLEKTDIPSIPQDVEHKLHEHSGLFPMTTKRLALKPRSSKDTLRTIFSVGSVEANFEAASVIPSVPTVPTVLEVEAESSDTPETKQAARRHTLQLMSLSLAQVAAQVMPRKPIARKPIPTRQEPVKGSIQQESEETTISIESGLPVEAQVTTHNSANIDMCSTGSSLETPSPFLPSPLLARAQFIRNKPRTPPPVSMVTRRPMSLRVPPPLRPQSSTASLGRKASRESLQDGSFTQPLMRTASQGSIHGQPYRQQTVINSPDSSVSAPIPPMDPRRIMSFRQSQYSSQNKTPRWDVQTDHGMTRRPSQTSLNGVSRHSSLSSSHSQDGLWIQRPASAQAWQVRTPQPPLRHRSSYDGYSHQQSRPQQGFAPSMSNGYTAPSKPAFDPGSMNHYDPVAGERTQYGRYPPHVPRGNHHRNQSVSYESNIPYRVLHSYNSPAYRNAPIWG